MIDPAFEQFIPIGDKEEAVESVFEQYSGGLKTNRDSWCYGFSRKAVVSTMTRMLDFYQEQLKGFRRISGSTPSSERLALAEKFIDTDNRNIAWSRGLVSDLAKLTERPFNKRAIRVGHYRPFCKQWVYFDRALNDMIYRLPLLFPTETAENIAICTTAAGNRDDFSVFITNTLPDVHMSDKSGASQCFPLYLYEPVDKASKQRLLIDLDQAGEVIDGYRRRTAITDSVLTQFQTAYGPRVNKEDIFYYLYGVLHSKEYRRRFASDLKKMLPRIPLTRESSDFKAFTKAGRDLAQLHLNYETVKPFPLDEHSNQLAFEAEKHFRVEKMTFARKDKAIDKSTIIYNSHIALQGIPLEAYEYIVNGKSAIEWIMERYQVTRDKDSGISNDPNDWAREQKQPRYIIDLLKRVITVSIETMKIVKHLPPLNERNKESTSLSVRA